MKTNQFILAASFASAVFFVGCAEAPKKEATEETVEIVEEEVIEDEEETAQLMLPSPIQIAAMFNRSGLTYNAELPNPSEAVSNYNTKTKKFLNFGIYSADMAYAVLNDKQQAAIDYLAAIKTLSDETGMEAIFGSGDLINRFEKNIGSKDSVLRILTEIKIKTDSYLQDNKDQAKTAVFFAGAWIEGMYLGAKSSKGTDNMIRARVLEQMNLLPSLIAGLKGQKEPSNELTELTNMLSEMNEFYGEQVDYNSEGDATLAEEDMTVLTEKITAIRTMIVSA
jgi:hypothetical protein